MAAAAGAGDPSPAVDEAAPTEDDVRALIALAALGGPDRLAHGERLALGRALEASPALRAELRALAAVAAALPPPGPRDTPPSSVAGVVPAALLRPEIVAALALLVLLLGVLRIAADPADDAAVPVATTTASAVSGTTEIAPRPWGVEIAIELDGTRPGAVYEVELTDGAGARTDVGSFLGDEDTVRFVATAGVARDDIRQVHVTDERGEDVLRGDLE